MSQLKGAAALASLLAFVAGLLAACGGKPVVVREAFVFGTHVEVTVAGRPEAEAAAAASAVFAEFDRLHRMLHAWRNSEVTALNAALAAGGEFEASEELSAMLADARGWTLKSDRLFDPGIGRLVALWGFHDDEFKPRLPDPEALAAWRAAQPSAAELQIDGRRIGSRNKAVAIDLGGYAKGYALDRAAAILRARGVTDALVNIGGNVLAMGAKHGKPWRIGIRDPRGSGFIAALDLRDGEAIGTSGDYQRYFEIDGRRYSHLLDPRSGQPAAGTQALTVLAAGGNAGVRSDVWSKPLFLAGAGEYRAVAGRLGVSAWLRIDADGRIAVSQALADRLDWREPVPPFSVF